MSEADTTPTTRPSTTTGTPEISCFVSKATSSRTLVWGEPSAKARSSRLVPLIELTPSNAGLYVFESSTATRRADGTGATPI